MLKIKLNPVKIENEQNKISFHVWLCELCSLYCSLLPDLPPTQPHMGVAFQLCPDSQNICKQITIEICTLPLFTQLNFCM